MRACACGLRTNAAWSIPGSLMSSTNRPSPRKRRGSSLRGTDAPKYLAPKPLSFRGWRSRARSGVERPSSYGSGRECQQRRRGLTLLDPHGIVRLRERPVRENLRMTIAPREFDFLAARRRLEAKPKPAVDKVTTLEDAVARI